MIDVINLQRKVKLETDVFRKYVTQLSSLVAEVGEKTFSVAFISDRRMTELNGLFRGKDSTTDVLSFPWSGDTLVPNEPEGRSSVSAASGSGDKSVAAQDDFLGDIVISAEQAERQAIENKLTLENEIKQLILHGLLHLCGYDHETDNGEMNKRELELRKKLKI